MGAQIVFWNCASPLILVQQPPIGQNFAIGVSEPYDRTTPEFINNMERRIRMTNLRSDKEFEFQGTAFVGDGHFESPDAPVLPRSLYQFQLQQRLAEQR